MYENNEDAAAPAESPVNIRASVQRPSHVWSSSKRAFMEDSEYEKLKASIGNPSELKSLQDKNQFVMQNMAQNDGNHGH